MTGTTGPAVAGDSAGDSATDAAIAIVEDFLAAVGQGRRSDADRHLARDVRMVFPGGKSFTGLADLAASAADRYRRVDKLRDTYEALETAAGEAVVYSVGRLFGENRFGVAFAGVRYVDRFRLRGNRIVEQWVWNDLAETGVLEARTPDEVAEPWRPAPDSAV